MRTSTSSSKTESICTDGKGKGGTILLQSKEVNELDEFKYLGSSVQTTEIVEPK